MLCPPLPLSRYLTCIAQKLLSAAGGTRDRCCFGRHLLRGKIRHKLGTPSCGSHRRVCLPNPPPHIIKPSHGAFGSGFGWRTHPQPEIAAESRPHAGTDSTRAAGNGCPPRCQRLQLLSPTPAPILAALCAAHGRPCSPRAQVQAAQGLVCSCRL